MLETAVVISKEGSPIHWHLPLERSTVYLPDSQDLWSVLWGSRANLEGVAHTHPGGGHYPSPSLEDLTTFVAVEKGLGRPLMWWIFNQTHGIRIWRVTLLDGWALQSEETQFSWLEQLRLHSHY